MNPLKLSDEPLGPRSAMLRLIQRHRFVWSGPKNDPIGASTEEGRQILIAAIERFVKLPHFIPQRTYNKHCSWWPWRI